MAATFPNLDIIFLNSRDGLSFDVFCISYSCRNLNGGHLELNPTFCNTINQCNNIFLASKNKANLDNKCAYKLCTILRVGMKIANYILIILCICHSIRSSYLYVCHFFLFTLDWQISKVITVFISFHKFVVNVTVALSLVSLAEPGHLTSNIWFIPATS